MKLLSTYQLLVLKLKMKKRIATQGRRLILQSCFLIEANSWLEKGNWTKAVELYTKGISCIDGSGTSGGEGQSAKNKKKKNKKKSKKRRNGAEAQIILQDSSKCLQLVPAYSSRAQAWHCLNNYEQALSDSLNALRLDAGHVTSLLYKGKALVGLGRYEEAVACLEVLQSSKAVTDAQQRTEMEQLLNHASTAQLRIPGGVPVNGAGHIEMWEKLEAYFASGCKGSPPDCHDFVGSVEIRRAPNMGRGLFVTKPVKEGDVLLVSSALAVSQVEPNTRFSMFLDPVSEELVVQIEENAKKNPGILRQIETLEKSLMCHRSDIPPMSVFSGGNPGKQHGVRQSRLELITAVSLNSMSTYGGGAILATFGYKLNYRKMRFKPEKFHAEDAADVAGIWVSPPSSTTPAAQTLHSGMWAKLCSSPLVGT